MVPFKGSSEGVDAHQDEAASYLMGRAKLSPTVIYINFALLWIRPFQFVCYICTICESTKCEFDGKNREGPKAGLFI